MICYIGKIKINGGSNMSFKDILYGIYGIVLVVFRMDGLWPESNSSLYWVDVFIRKLYDLFDF